MRPRLGVIRGRAVSSRSARKTTSRAVPSSVRRRLRDDDLTVVPRVPRVRGRHARVTVDEATSSSLPISSKIRLDMAFGTKS